MDRADLHLNVCSIPKGADFSLQSFFWKTCFKSVTFTGSLLFQTFTCIHIVSLVVLLKCWWNLTEGKFKRFFFACNRNWKCWLTHENATKVIIIKFSTQVWIKPPRVKLPFMYLWILHVHILTCVLWCKCGMDPYQHCLTSVVSNPPQAICFSATAVNVQDLLI